MATCSLPVSFCLRIFPSVWENDGTFPIGRVLAPILSVSQDRGELLSAECLPPPPTAVLGPGEPQHLRARSCPMLPGRWCGKCPTGDVNQVRGGQSCPSGWGGQRARSRQNRHGVWLTLRDPRAADTKGACVGAGSAAEARDRCGRPCKALDVSVQLIGRRGMFRAQGLGFRRMPGSCAEWMRAEGTRSNTMKAREFHKALKRQWRQEKRELASTAVLKMQA